jgi:hypothetical protein
MDILTRNFKLETLLSVATKAPWGEPLGLPEFAGQGADTLYGPVRIYAYIHTHIYIYMHITQENNVFYIYAWGYEMFIVCMYVCMHA